MQIVVAQRDLRPREAGLVDADLRKAVLRRADLSGARLQNTKLDEADLRGARVDPTLWTSAALRGATGEQLAEPGRTRRVNAASTWPCGGARGISKPSDVSGIRISSRSAARRVSIRPGGKLGEIGEGVVPDLAVLTVGLPQQAGRLGL